MTTPRRRRRSSRRPSDRRQSARSFLAGLAEDLGYLEFKERMGEVLSVSERAALDAHRQQLHLAAWTAAHEASPAGGGG